MTARILLIFFVILLSCSKEEAKYEPKPRSDPYKLYEDAYQAFENGDYFYAQKYGNKDQIMSNYGKNLVHVVFMSNETHGDKYLYISPWLAKTQANKGNQ